VLNTKNQFKSINQLYYGDEFYWWRKQNTDMLQVNDIYTGTFLLPKTVASLICTNIDMWFYISDRKIQTFIPQENPVLLCIL
jgi:hypothetical protein